MSRRHHIIEGGGGEIEYLDYITCDGRQWIDTGFKSYDASTIEISCKWQLSATGINTNDVIYGWYSNWNSAFCLIFESINISDRLQFRCEKGSERRVTKTGIVANTWYETKQTFTNTTFNGTTNSYSPSSTVNPACNINIYMSAGGRSSSALRPMYGKIAQFSIKVNGSLKADYKPARLNGVVGMWDEISQTFKRSDSGVDFI